MNRYTKPLSDFLKEKKSKYVVASVLIAFLLIIFRTWIQKDFIEEDVLPFYEKAEVLMDQKDYKGAILEFKKCLKEDWRDWLTYYYLGYCYYLIGDNSKSIFYYKKSSDLIGIIHKLRNENVKPIKKGKLGREDHWGIGCHFI